MSKSIFVTAMFYIYASVGFSQITKTKNDVATMDEIKLDEKSKLIITGISKTDEKKIVIKDEGDNDPGPDLKRAYDQTHSTLSFDLKTLLTKNPNNHYFLFFIDDSKKPLVASKENSLVLDNNKPTQRTGYTGIAFWDAKAIVNLWNDKRGNDAKKLVISWIQKYSARNITEDNILENPFFEKSAIIRSVKEKQISSPQGALPGIKDILGNISGLDVTKYVQAFADFLKERIKEELTVAYLEKLKAAIEASEELQYLLPKTRTVFLTNAPFDIPNMGATYKAAFAEDLQNLLPNFEKMVNAVDDYKNLRNSEGFVGFMVGYHFADMSAKNYHPSEILRTLTNSYPYQNDRAPIITYSVAVLNMFSQNLLDTSGKNWAGRNELRNISRDEVYIFLGLLYEKYKDLFDASLKGKTNLKDIALALIKTSESPIVDKLYNFLLIANTIDERIKDFKQSDKKIEVILTLFTNNVDAIEEMIDFVQELTGAQAINTKEYYKWKNVIELSLEAEKGVKENDLGKVGGNVIAITNELFPENKKWKRDLAVFIKLLTDITSAKTSEDIKGLLDHYAAPLHSYRVARISKYSSSVASYPGLYAGYESNFNEKKANAFSFGVTAPIGIAFHRGALGSKQNAGRSNSIFIGLFDIGAALSYRWNNDTLDLPQKITLGQIFSPGIFYVNGWKNSPLAWKWGMQYTPQLRQIKEGANVISKNIGVVRFSLGLTVDIPVFILSRKQSD